MNTKIITITLMIVAIALFIGCESTEQVVDHSTDNQVVNGSEDGCKKFYNLGMNYQRSRLWVEAAEFYQKAITCSTDYIDAYIAFGNMYEDLDSTSAAEQVWIDMQTNNPEAIESYTHYGAFLADQGRYDESEQAFLKAHEICPDNPTPILGLADVLTQQEKFDQARPYLEQALAFTEDEDKIIAIKQRLAKCAVGMGDPSYAATLLEDILIRYPDRLEIHEWLVEAYKSMNDWTKALEHMEIVATEDPTLENTMKYGALLAQAGRSSEAISTFRKAISMGGGLSAYKQVIGLLQRSGQTSLAMQFAEEALASYSSDSYLNLVVGNKYYAMAVDAYNNSDWDGAINYCDMAIGYYSNASSGSYVGQAQEKLNSAQQLREAARLKKIY